MIRYLKKRARILHAFIYNFIEIISKINIVIKYKKEQYIAYLTSIIRRLLLLYLFSIFLFILYNYRLKRNIDKGTPKKTRS